MINKSLLTVLFALAFSAVAYAQNRTVSGTVTGSDDGLPLPQVSVLLKGTTTGVPTNIDGEYRIRVPEGGTLVFSFLGYVTQEVEIGNRTVIDVVLEPDVTSLSEVVVVGYGEQQRKEVSGAVAQVSGEELTQAPISTLTNTLSGRLPGLTINQTSSEPGRESATVLIRGQGTIDTDTNDGINPNGALVVIDGIANVDGLARLDPNDIESVTILKDASAAIYGAQAANGVVLITTKRGKSGTPQFNYSFNQGFNSPISLAKLANAEEYMTFLNRNKARGDNWDPKALKLYSADAFAKVRSGETPDTEWYHSSFKEYFAQSQHNFSVRGGTEKTRYFFSARYLDQGTVFVGDNEGGNKQFNIRSNTDFTFGEGLDVGLNIALRQQNVRNHIGRQNGVITNALLSSPLLPKYVNGDTRYPAAGRAQQNPIAYLRTPGYESNERRNLSAQINFNYKIPALEGLAVGGFASVGISTDMQKNFNAPLTYYRPNAKDPKNGTPQAVKFLNTQLDHRNDRRQIVTTNFRTTYKKSIGEHNMDVLLQVEQQEIRFDRVDAGKDKFLASSSDLLNAGSAAREDSYVSGSASERARLGYSGRLNYNFRGKYIFQYIFRYDGSDRFAKGKRFGFFPGASVAWVASDEDFLKNSSVVNFLKVRLSWGQLGNDRISAFNYLSRFSQGRNTVINGTTVPGVQEAGVPNPDVTWETSETKNIGIEASFFDNALSLELDLFETQTKGILVQPLLTLPQITGITPPRQNLGRHRNRGFELALNYNNQINEDLSFSVGGNVSFSRNKVLEFEEPPFDAAYQNQTGRRWGSPLMYHAIGIFKTQEQLDQLPKRSGDRLGWAIIQDTNGDGKITPADRIRVQPGYHEFFFGFNTRIAYKNFDLNMLWQGAAGGVRTLNTFFGPNNNGLAYWVGASWGTDNPNARFPAPGQGTDTDIYRVSADYLRLKTLELGYNLPKGLIEKMGFNSVRVYTNGYNLLTFSKLLSEYGFSDPEQTSAVGRDYPMLKTFNFGVNVSL